MAQQLTVKTKGLYTNTNEFSESPEGSLLLAENVVIDRDSIIESRRGFDTLLYKFRNTSDRAHNLFVYQEKILAHNSTDLMSWYDSTAVTATGNFTSTTSIITSIAPNTTNFSVGQTVLGSYRFTVQTVADVASSLNNTYFLFNSADNTTRYYCWFNVGGAGVDPNVPSRTAVPVAFAANSTAATIATAIQVAIDALADFIATVLTDTVTVTNASAGTADIARNGPGTASPSFSITNVGTGIPAGTVIDSIDSATQITLSNAVTDTRSSQSLAVVGWRNYSGTYAEPNTSLGRVRGVTANQNFYFVTDGGVKKLDAYNSTPINAGGVKAIDGTSTTSGSSGFLLTNAQVAYRLVWGYKDANNNLILGVPSQRIICTNTSGGSRDVSLTFFIPDGVTTDFFYQVYRSAQTVGSTVTPNDELNQVIEDNPTSAQITAKTITITDNTPESLRDGPALYTNPSQETILGANEVPPFSQDIAVFRNSTFYANTKTRQKLSITNLAVAGSTGLNYLSLAATYVNATSFTVADSTGIAAGMSITGSQTNVPLGITVSSVSGTTINITGGSLVAWGATITLQFRDVLTIAGLTYTSNNIQRSSSTVTMTITSPGVVTWTAHGLTNASTVYFTTTGALPTGLVASTTYYVVNVTANTFEVSATQGGSSINFTGSQSGVHTAVANDRKFLVATTGSAAQNIQDTITSLCRVINAAADNTTVYAYYSSGPDDLPGMFYIEGRTVAIAEFSATISSHGTAFSPTLPSSGTLVSSTNDTFLNGLYYSKTLQPDSVPIGNYFRVGDADQPILRIVPLRDALFIFKADGIYRLIGLDPSTFRVDLLDNTAVLVAPETAVPLNNQIYCLCTQGVVTVSDNGVGVVSRQIENELLRLLSVDLTDVAKLSFGVAYESDRKYILSIIKTSSDTTPTQSYVLNIFTNAWTIWTVSKGCGLVNYVNDRLYFGDAVSNGVNVERKARDFTDYADDQFTAVLSSFSEKTLVLSDVSDVEVGDLVFQGNTVLTTVLTVDAVTDTITVQDTVSWVAPADISILKAIQTKIEYIPNVAKNPGVTKQFREISLLFKQGFFNNLVLSFVSDLSGQRDEVTLTGFQIGLWGLFPFGELAWGGVQRSIAVRTYIPQSKQRCSQLSIRLTHREGYSFYALNGFSLIYNTMSERLKR